MLVFVVKKRAENWRERERKKPTSWFFMVDILAYLCNQFSTEMLSNFCSQGCRASLTGQSNSSCEENFGGNISWLALFSTSRAHSNVDFHWWMEKSEEFHGPWIFLFFLKRVLVSAFPRVNSVQFFPWFCGKSSCKKGFQSHFPWLIFHHSNVNLPR